MTTTDSKAWGGTSGHSYTLKRQRDGTTEVDAVVVRVGKNIKGRLLGLVVGTVGKRTRSRSSKRPSRPSKPGTAA